ncbi:MAG: hypothetical protein NZ533_06410 [Casimicrobiaceae bacterium]|nr:hypothetical protein [Casimicrobiaceae bacterium]MDW8312918.1 hypothetical protein [Burkholderiales bacterium]
MAAFVRAGAVGLRVPEGEWRGWYPGSSWQPAALGEDWLGEAPEPTLRLKGEFTPLRFLIDLPTELLERSLGWTAGRLQGGYRIVALASEQALRPSDLEVPELEHGVGIGASVDERAQIIRRPMSASVGGAASQSSERSRVEALKAALCEALRATPSNAPAIVLPNDPPGSPLASLKAPYRPLVPCYRLLVEHTFTVVKVVPGVLPV